MTSQITRSKADTSLVELPIEIEQIIFSLALHNDWKGFIDLILVAKRVYHWLIPDIYEIAIIHYETSKERHLRLSSYGLIPHGKHVKHLMLSNARNPDKTGLHHSPSHCLSLCPNITDLSLSLVDRQYHIELIDQIINLRHLTHLSFEFGALNEGLTNANRELCPPLTSVTHLDVNTIRTTPTPEDIHMMFPSLTHLALKGDGRVDISILHRVLELWKGQLEVIVWYKQGGQDETHVLPTEYLIHIDTPRVVVLWRGWDRYVDEWFQDAIGGVGLWKMAEDAVGQNIRRLEA